MGTQDHTDDELSGLTADERAMLADLEGADAGSGGEGEGDDGGDGGDDGASTGGNEGDAGNDQGAGDGGNAGTVDESTDRKTAAERVEPIYQAQTDANIDAQLKELAQARRDARRKYEEGELTEDDYDAELDRIEQERDKANSARIRAEVSADMTAQQLTRAYHATVGSFFDDVKKAGFDYKAEANKGAMQYLDKTIKALAQTAEGEEGPELWREILSNAHLLTAAKFKIAAGKPEPKPDAGKGNKAAEVARSRTPDLSNVPPTVGRGPSAGTPSVNSDEFSHLDGLSGIALERAVARLTPDQQERWEAAE